MNTLNAGKTIDHSSKGPSSSFSIPSYQHGIPYMLPEKKLPSSINIRRQQNMTIDMRNTQARTVFVENPTSVDQYTSNLNFAIWQLNEAQKRD